jgi:hypothetical protein
MTCQLEFKIWNFQHWNVPVSTVVETMAMNHPEVATYREKMVHYVYYTNK